VAKLIGVEVERAENGESLATMVAEERHSNPMGTIHGGILCDLADAAMGTAYFSTLEPGESFTTLELKINFLRPFWTGRLVAGSSRAGERSGWPNATSRTTKAA